MVWWSAALSGGLQLLCLVTICSFTVTKATKCYKNEVLGEREGNVYYCTDPEKTDCCEEDNQFTCCEPASSQTLKDQLLLWGCVAAVVLVIALGCCYFWKDCTWLKDDTPLSKKCCSCCRKPEEDEKELSPIENVRRGMTPYKPAPWASGSYNHFQVEDCQTPEPAPAFKFKSPTYRKY